MRKWRGVVLISISAPLQGVALAQAQLEAGDCQELGIKHKNHI